MTAMSKRAPYIDIDLFADASLKAPFDNYCRLRDAGPLVRLRRPDVHAIGRFVNVQAALRAPEVLCSGEGVGFSESVNASSSNGTSVIQSDDEVHRRLRIIISRPLGLARLREARTGLKAMINERVRALAGQGWFDAMKSLASCLPIEAVAHLVGLPDFGRERMLEWAAATFNLIGPDQNPRDLVALAEARAFISSLSKDCVRDGSWAAELFAAERSGRLSSIEVMAAISAYVFPSLDTTILATGHLLNNIAIYPEQWALIRENPDLIPSAVLEGVRHDSVIRWFSRVARADYDVDGYVVPRGARVMLLYGCANRDERRYADPSSFDITRDARDHLGWGTGPHTCVGMYLARMEMEVLLEALVEADVSLRAGEPVLGTNAGLFGFRELPYRIDQRCDVRSGS
jgi:cytochrome P450